MVVFDTTILLPVLWSGVPVPNHPQTGQPVEGFRDRIDCLVAHLEQSRTKIIIPTPALSEILVRAGTAGPEYLAQINARAAFRIVAFDERAAVEVAAMTRKAIDAGDKRGGVDATWNKIKYDRQIVAIAKVEGAAALYSDDPGVRAFGNGVGLTVIGSWELPLPPEDPPTLFDQVEPQADVEKAENADETEDAMETDDADDGKEEKE